MLSGSICFNSYFSCFELSDLKVFVLCYKIATLVSPQHRVIKYTCREVIRLGKHLAVPSPHAPKVWAHTVSYGEGGGEDTFFLFTYLVFIIFFNLYKAIQTYTMAELYA